MRRKTPQRRKPVRTRLKKDETAAAVRHQSTVLLENIYDKITILGEGIEGLQHSVDERFAQVEKRFDGVDKELKMINMKLNTKVDQTIHNKLELRVRILEKRNTVGEKKIQ